jgi:hypothetical protein
MAIVYLHKKKGTDSVFYIGVGKNKYRASSRAGRNKYWHNTVQKYGYDIEIIYENISIETALQKEKQLISYYGRDKLVNLTDGGEYYSFWKDKKLKESHKKSISESLKGRTFSDEHKINLKGPKSKKHKENISKGRKGIKFSKEHLKNLSISHIGKPSPKKGCNVPDEVKKQISKTLKGNTNAKTRKVFQYDLEGNFIKKWDKIVDIKNDLGFSGSSISSCLNGRRKTYKGFIWKSE